MRVGKGLAHPPLDTGRKERRDLQERDEGGITISGKLQLEMESRP